MRGRYRVGRAVEQAEHLGRHEGRAHHAKEQEAADGPELGLLRRWTELGTDLGVDVAHELLDLGRHHLLAVDDALVELLCHEPQLEAVDGGVGRIAHLVRIDLHRRHAKHVHGRVAILQVIIVCFHHVPRPLT